MAICHRIFIARARNCSSHARKCSSHARKYLSHARKCPSPQSFQQKVWPPPSWVLDEGLWVGVTADLYPVGCITNHIFPWFVGFFLVTTAVTLGNFFLTYNISRSLTSVNPKLCKWTAQFVNAQPICIKNPDTSLCRELVFFNSPYSGKLPDMPWRLSPDLWRFSLRRWWCNHPWHNSNRTCCHYAPWHP